MFFNSHKFKFVEEIMRCILCESLSFNAVCKLCAAKLLLEDKRSRTLKNGLKVYSFFGYDSIASVLCLKHYFWGHRVLKQIAKITFGEFAKTFHFPQKVAAIGIDDAAYDGYSHTAILSKALKSTSIEPIFGALRAKNRVKYSGKTYEFRRKNPRRFVSRLNGFDNVILIDDVITSGLTLQEASEQLKKDGVNVLFALTLADAKDN
jgi:competence protein ComFC